MRRREAGVVLAERARRPVDRVRGRIGGGPYMQPGEGLVLVPAPVHMPKDPATAQSRGLVRRARFGDQPGQKRCSYCQAAAVEGIAL